MKKLLIGLIMAVISINAFAFKIISEEIKVSKGVKDYYIEHGPYVVGKIDELEKQK